jgi:hypothetical protein
LFLGGSDVASLLDIDELAGALRTGFLKQDAAASTGLRVTADLPGGATATALLPGLLAGIPAYTAKLNAKFPAALPALRGVVCLHGLDDGRLLAVLDSASLTAWRTGIAAAVATDVLEQDEHGLTFVFGEEFGFAERRIGTNAIELTAVTGSALLLIRRTTTLGLVGRVDALTRICGCLCAHSDVRE